MESGHRRATWQIAVLAGSVFGLLVFVTCLVTLRWGGISQGLAWLRGEAIYMMPRVCDFGDVPVAETAMVKIGVQNLWSAPEMVLGATSSCACTAILGIFAAATCGGGPANAPCGCVQVMQGPLDGPRVNSACVCQ